MKNIQTVISTEVPIIYNGTDFIPVSLSFAGKKRILTRDASIRILRPVSVVWNTLTDREFWKSFFFYDEFQGEIHAFSEFIGRGIRNGKPFQEHGEFTAVRPGLLIQYHVWHWGSSPEQDSDSGVTISFRDTGTGAAKITILQTWRVLDDETRPSFDWDVQLLRIKTLLENISG